MFAFPRNQNTARRVYGFEVGHGDFPGRLGVWSGRPPFSALRLPNCSFPHARNPRSPLRSLRALPWALTLHLARFTFHAVGRAFFFASDPPGLSVCCMYPLPVCSFST